MMQTEPKKNLAKTYAPVGVVAVIFLAGFGYYLTNNSTVSGNFGNLGPNPGQGLSSLTFHYSNGVIALSDFLAEVNAKYSGGGLFGAYTGCFNIIAQNDLFQLPANPLGLSDLRVSSGTIEICPVAAGLFFDFSGTATSGQATITRLTLTLAFNPLAQTVTTSTATASTLCGYGTCRTVTP